MKPVGENSFRPLPGRQPVTGKVIRTPETSPQVSVGQPAPEKAGQSNPSPSFVVALKTAQGTPQQTGAGAALPVNAAAQSSVANQPATISSQIIVKFSGAIGDPPASAFLDGLANDAGGSVGQLRAMSGGAYVLTVEHPANVPLSHVLEGLSARADVSYAEEDARMSTMGTGISASAPTKKIR